MVISYNLEVSWGAPFSLAPSGKLNGFAPRSCKAQLHSSSQSSCFLLWVYWWFEGSSGNYILCPAAFPVFQFSTFSASLPSLSSHHPGPFSLLRALYIPFLAWCRELNNDHLKIWVSLWLSLHRKRFFRFFFSCPFPKRNSGNNIFSVLLSKMSPSKLFLKHDNCDGL